MRLSGQDERGRPTTCRIPAGGSVAWRRAAPPLQCREELRRLGAINIVVTLPAPGEIILLRDGHRVLTTRGSGLNYTSIEPGIYRVEVYRHFRGRRVGWIFTSPIYAR